MRDKECDQRDREVPRETADMGFSSFTKDFTLRLPIKKLLEKIQLTDSKRAESRSPIHSLSKPPAPKCFHWQLPQRELKTLGNTDLCCKNSLCI